MSRCQLTPNDISKAFTIHQNQAVQYCHCGQKWTGISVSQSDKGSNDLYNSCTAYVNS